MTVLLYQEVRDTEYQIIHQDSGHAVFTIVKQKKFARHATHTIYRGDKPYATLRRGNGGKVCLLESGTQLSFRNFLRAKGMLSNRDRFCVHGETFQMRSSRISTALELVDPNQPASASPLAIFFLGPPGEIHILDGSQKAEDMLLVDGDDATDLLAYALIAEMIARDNTVRYATNALVSGVKGPGGTAVEFIGRSL